MGNAARDGSSWGQKPKRFTHGLSLKAFSLQPIYLSSYQLLYMPLPAVNSLEAGR